MPHSSYTLKAVLPGVILWTYFITIMNNCFGHGGSSRLVTMTHCDWSSDEPTRVIQWISGLAFHSLDLWCNSHMICHLMQIVAFKNISPGGHFGILQKFNRSPVLAFSCVAGVKRGGRPEGARREFSTPGAYHPVCSPSALPGQCGLPHSPPLTFTLARGSYQLRRLREGLNLKDRDGWKRL